MTRITHPLRTEARSGEAAQDSGHVLAVLDAVQDGVCLLDATGRVTYANRRAFEHWRLLGPEILGQILWERFPALRGTEVETGARRALSGTADACEFISPVTNRWLSINFQPLPTGACAIWRDITDRIEARRLLHASDQALLMAQEAAGIGTFVWDLRSGEINWSPGMYRLLGVDPETPGSERYEAWLRVLHPADRLAVESEETRRQNAPPGGFVREFRIVRPDGEIRWILARGMVSWDDEGPSGMFGFDMDITERKRMESALREGGAKFRAVFEQSPLGKATVGSDTRFREVNPALCRMLGYTAEEVIGRSYLDLVHPDDLDECRRQGRALAKGTIPQLQLEERYIQKSGEIVWVNLNVGLIRDQDGASLYSLAIFEDITERKRISEALRRSQERLWRLNERLEQEAERRARQLAESRARLQVFFDSSLDWLSLLRAEPDGSFVCVDMNPACRRGLGLSRRRVIGRQVADILGEEQGDLQLRRLRDCLRTGRPQHYRAQPVIAGKKRSLDVMFVPVPVENERGERLIVATAHDMTEREELEAQLRQIQKLDALGQLTGGIAHDFNNLLAAILGSLELATRSVSEPRTVRLLSTAARAAERGAKLTAQMLAFSRKQDLSIRPVEANKVIRGMEDLLARTLGPSVSVRLDLDPDLWLAMADPVQLEVVLLNLAVNARDAMPRGGQLWLSSRNARGTELGPEAEALAPGEYIVLAVRDTGEGMTEEVRAKAFEPFFTTKGPGKGTGLGLAQVFGFARQAGGTVNLKSIAGAGTTVSVYLPRSDALLAVPTQEARPASAASSRLRVLLVDDDEAVRSLAGEMLREAGHGVTTLATGGEALRVLAGDEPVDLLVLDYAMPGMTGSEVATAARQLRPALPILFMTGFAETDALRPWVREGCRVLNKPFRSDELSRAVAESVLVAGTPKDGTKAL